MNPRVLEIAPSLIREISAKKKSTSIDLGLGEPSLFPNREHLEAAMQYVLEYGLKYTPNAGDLALRQAIAHHYGYPKMDRAENVCVTVGSQEAMYVALKTLLDPARDELLIVEPCFPSYQKMAALEGIAVRSVAMSEAEGFAFDSERIAAAIGERTRAIVICSPCNPTARVISEAAAEILVRAVERRAGEPIWLVHDEIYREQVFVDDAAELARRYPHTIVTNSLSKSNALTGLRLGWLLGPSSSVDAGDQGSCLGDLMRRHLRTARCFARLQSSRCIGGTHGVVSRAASTPLGGTACERPSLHIARRNLLRLRAPPEGYAFVRRSPRAHRTLRCGSDSRHRIRTFNGGLAAPELGILARPGL